MAFWVWGSLALLCDHWVLVTLALFAMLASEVAMFAGLREEEAIRWRTCLHAPWHCLSIGVLAYLAVTTYADEPRLYTLFAPLCGFSTVQ